ncbi:MAG: SDR family oxidoreductase [Bdellovibrionales bacterium]|nr:SDR family oxidoreductase [Oligoflexia bacterium]
MSNPLPSQKFKKVLITGASQGIGRALAEKFARLGADLLLVARNESALKDLSETLEKANAGIRVQYLKLDLSKADSAKVLKAFCVEKNFQVDTLVNNAGYGVWGQFGELTLQEQLDCMNVNMTAVVQLTHEFLPLLTKHAQSYILNVASTVAYQAMPTFAIYAATKSFVLSFSRALHHELKPQGVFVTTLVPGATDSQFLERAGLQHTAEKAKKVSMTAEAVAEIGIKGLSKGQIEVIAGGLNKMIAGATRFLPKKVLEHAAESIYRK